MTTKIEEMKVDADSLDNPMTGMHGLPPSTPGLPSLPRTNSQLVDKARLLQAWESNVKTLRGVIDQLQLNASAMRLTRWFTVCVLVVILALGYLLRVQSLEVIERTQQVQTQVSTLAQHVDERLLAQEQKTDLVLNAMAQLLEAKLAEDAAKASPKDADLKREAVRTRVQALGSALAAKKEVAPAPAVAKEAETKLKALKVEAAEKGLEVQLPAP